MTSTRQFDRNARGTVNQRRRPQLSSDQGVVVEKKRPKLRERGTDGVAYGKRPAQSGNGRPGGVHRRWQGGGAGGGSGVHAPTLSKQSEGLYDYLRALSARLRRVRVCCGDWTRVLTPSVTTYIGITGVVLDPPYAHDLRERCYSEDHDISADVRAWALEHGDDPKFRIVLCGYQDEHGPNMPPTWECVPWKAHGGYSRSERGKKNRSEERLWFSPHCLRPTDRLPFHEQAAAEAAP